MTKVNSVEEIKPNDQNDNYKPVSYTDELKNILIVFKENPFRLKGTMEQIEKLFSLKLKQLEKENAELKKTIKYLDGVSMLNEDLIKENDKLKLDLTIKKEHIIEVLTKHLKPEDSNESYFEHIAINQIANEILNNKPVDI